MAGPLVEVQFAPATRVEIVAVERGIVARTNALRAESRLAALTVSDKLAAAARAYALLLARAGSFSHKADGRQASDRVREAGYGACLVGENLSLQSDPKGFSNDQLVGAVLAGWQASPAHRANLLEPHATEIGVGVAHVAGQERYVTVQLLARPDSLAYRFAIDNTTQAEIGYRIGSERLSIAPGTGVRHAGCLPIELQFETARANGAIRRLEARFVARNGDAYVVKGAPAGSIVVDVVRLP